MGQAGTRLDYDSLGKYPLHIEIRNREISIGTQAPLGPDPEGKGGRVLFSLPTCFHKVHRFLFNYILYLNLSMNDRNFGLRLDMV